MTTFAGVLGFPVAHSRSPAMMNAAFRELGIDWTYLRLPVPPELFEGTARALPVSGYAGANVTIPHKEAALALADERGSEAAAIGAANTLSFNDGAVRADNTDAGGLLDALSVDPAGRTALVLGAGGSARAAVWALREAGADVAVWNRTAERAERLAAELEVKRAEHPRAAELVVNATAVGLGGEDAVEELGLSELEPEVVVDLVYGAEPPPLARWARARGAAVVDGIEVLVAQGARSLRLWTGREPPVETMRAAARK